MKSVYLRLLTIIFAIAQVTAVLAEESKAEVDFNILTNEESTVTHNGVKYMLPEEILTLTLAIEESQEIATVTEVNVLVSSSAGSNVSFPLSYELKNGVVTFQNKTFTLPEANVDYTIQVSMSYSVVPPVEPETPGDDAEEEERPAYDATRTLVYNAPVKLHLKETPQVGEISTLKECYYAGTTVEAHVQSLGGNTNGWKFSWDGGEFSNSSQYEFTTTSQGLEVTDNSFVVVVRNYAPDSKTIWFEETYSFPIHTYPAPSINVVGSQNVTLKDGEEYIIGVETSGGVADAWEYNWKYEGSTLGHTEKTLFIDATNKTMADRDDDYQLVVVNTLPNGEKYSQIYNFTVCVEGIDITWSAELPTDVVEGDEINGAVSIDGALKSKWTYTWKLEGENLNKDSYSCKFIAPEVEEDGGYFTLSVKAEILPGGIFDHTLYHTIKVWDTPNTEKKSLDDIVLLHGQHYEFAIEATGGLPSGWTYEWFVDAVKISGATTNSYNATMQHTGSGVKYCVYKVIARNTTNGIVREFVETFNAEVWPAVSETHSPESQDYHYGDDVNLSFNVVGGYADGWEYTWRDDVGINNITELSKNSWYNYTIADSNTASTTDEFTLIVVNNHTKAPNGPLYEKEITFKVTGWSHGSVSSMSFANNHEQYRSGDDIPVTVTTVGGFPNWLYKWYYNDELVATTTDPQYTFQAQINEGQTYDERGVLTISMFDAYNDGWNGCELIIKQDGEYLSTVTINNGNHNTVQFVYDPNCSYEFYWNVGSYSSECSFYIAIDDEVVFSANGSQCGSFSDGQLVYQRESQVHMFVVDQVTVVAENTIPANLHKKSCNESKGFRVYAVEEFADDFTMPQATSCGGYNTYAIRSGNTLDFNVERATGGYNLYNDSYWYYTWYENGVVKKSGSTPGKNSYQIASVPGNNSEVKRVDTKTYHLEISNMGPYDQEWYNKEYEEKVLKVYARPQIPSKLMIKGNGTTNTLVCTINLADETLKTREYFFVFGYTDASGKDHEMEPTPNRWCQMKNVSVNDAQKRFWVYTRWNYDEDTYVSSGRIFLDGAIEHEFDASCYNGNEVGVRGTTTDIQNFDADGIYFDGRRLVVDANHSVECIITVTSLDGKNLEINNLGSCSSFDETIDVSKYGRGIYIVRIKVGDKVINRKIVVS